MSCAPALTEKNHDDGYKPNNRLSNLEYVTPEENREHAIRLGLVAPINPNTVLPSRRKFDVTEVPMIRELAQQIGHARVAALYGVDKKTIWRMVNRVHYSEVA